MCPPGLHQALQSAVLHGACGRCRPCCRSRVRLPPSAHLIAHELCDLILNECGVDAGRLIEQVIACFIPIGFRLGACAAHPHLGVEWGQPALTLAELIDKMPPLAVALRPVVAGAVAKDARDLLHLTVTLARLFPIGPTCECALASP